MAEQRRPYRIVSITGEVERKPGPRQQRLDELLDIALRFHRQGNLPEAELIYREVLREDFDNADAWHLLGVLIYESGYCEVALELLSEAVAIDPQEPLYHNSLGNTRRRLGELGEALQSYDRAIALAPSYAEAHYNRAGVLRDQGDLGQAVEAYETARRLNPSSEVLNDLAGALRLIGNLDAALACYREAADLNPDEPRIQMNLGSALEERGEIDEAIKSYRRAARIAPNLAEAHRRLERGLESQEHPEGTEEVSRVDNEGNDPS